MNNYKHFLLARYFHGYTEKCVNVIWFIYVKLFLKDS